LSRNDELKIAAFTDTYDQVNGAATTYRHLMEYVATTGKHLDLFCYGTSSQKEDVQIEQRGTGRIFRFRHTFSVRYYEQLRFEIFGNRHVRRIFRSNNYDVVHIAAPGSMGYQGIALGKKCKLPIVGAYHTRLDEYAALGVPKLFSGMARRISWDLLLRFYHSCNCVLTPTPSMADSLRRNGMKTRIALFARGVNTELFHPSRRTCEQPTALYVGRISKEKNLDLIAETLQQSRNHAGSDAIRMMFVGDGPHLPALKRQLPDATFTGYLHGERLAEAYANANLFVFPSLTDTFGNVVQEAMASGVPSLVLDRTGPGELITPGVDGFLANNSEQFKQMFWDLMRQPELLRTAGNEARRSAEGRTWKVVFDHLWRVYGDCASL